MPPPDGAKPPVVEPAPEGGNADVTLRALQQRIRQQELLAVLGVRSLQGASLDELLTEAARLTAEGLRTEFCKVLEYIPAENCLFVRAGVGWDKGIVGAARVGADLASPSGFALRTGRPVISNHLENEKRFRTPDILKNHGVVRAMNVIVQGDGKPFGVLEADSRSEDDFDEHDIAFLQGAANILGMAIEREHREQNLKAALERQQLLLGEMNHRVKNSLAIVASMLHLQASAVGDPNLGPHLTEASHRVRAIARVHDQLNQGSDIEQLDVGKYIQSVCKDLDDSVSKCEIITYAEQGIEIGTDRAVSTALIANELITNAAKYGYRGLSGGKIWVTLGRSGDSHFSLSVRDDGAGLPAGFDPNAEKGLGMRIIRLLMQQLGGSLAFKEHGKGAEFIVTLPVQPPRVNQEFGGG